MMLDQPISQVRALTINMGMGGKGAHNPQVLTAFLVKCPLIVYIAFDSHVIVMKTPFYCHRPTILAKSPWDTFKKL